MSESLTETQVARIVAEVTRQSQLRELEQQEVLGRQHVVQILEDLDLPVELLDPAMQALERRRAEEQVQKNYDDALSKQRKRRALIIASILIVVLSVVLVAGIYFQRRSAAFSAITTVGTGRITRVGDDGGSLSTITRDGSEVAYRVTLDRVPLSENLSFKCNWIDPAGQVVKQNSWQSRTTDKTVWATSCRNTFGTGSTAGRWKVEMLLNDRTLSKTDFQVE